MKYLLDTNICVHFFCGKFNLASKFQEVGLSSCAISEITLAELIYGAEHSTNPQKNFNLIESFSSEVTILPIINCIYLYGKEKSRLRKNGTMISDFDLLIGTTAITSDLIMVTENISEFERIKEVKLENWINR
jgi:tRNA(fMet)-specific endonuclease VapC